MRPYDPLLYPFSWLYDGLTRFRNHLFDKNVKKSIQFSIPIVSIGNLSMGGTGKTPMVEFLINQLKSSYKIATLSRGYGRQTSGFLLANRQTGPHQIGDEPYQIFSKFHHEVAVAVGENRVEAIPLLIAEKPETELILLDDAFQHRYVRRDYNVVLTTYQSPFYDDQVLPLGTLREHPKGVNRADLLVVTKCPEEVSEGIKQEMIRKTQHIAGWPIPVLFSKIQYGEPYLVLGSSTEIGKSVILMTGIANPVTLEKHVAAHFILLDNLIFPDHHRYSLKDMEKLKKVFDAYRDQKPVVLTTEKDAVKLKDLKIHEYLREFAIFAIPMEISMAEAERDLLITQIKQVIKDKRNNSED
ncbi:tetraacyldisaccharide 4'-kinase [Pararhodonellum marinum]|uniref:tetraacyldisaccharide 4'-kinase n=1 Tax=Pararhodonellum marinum TaxID=2755358 RepID=UPI00188F2842|nr:tetraacyldisaccharide 4'-kinase [Pararhodonellum marinum]